MPGDDHPSEIERQRRRFDRRALVWTIPGLVLLGHAPYGLRWAHRYRQRTAEGIAFVGILLELVLASLVLAVGVAMLVHAASWTQSRWSRLGRTLVWQAILVLVVAAWVFALWVVSHGARCIGPCG